MDTSAIGCLVVLAGAIVVGLLLRPIVKRFVRK